MAVGTLFRVGAVQVFVGAEDHAPPHVHAFHTGDGWRARFRFSFLSDVAGLYRFRRRGRKPTEATLNTVLGAFVERLPTCRAAWWDVQGPRHELGLVNLSIEIRPMPTGEEMAKIARTPGPDSTRIDAAAYDPATAEVLLSLVDGRRFVLAAGRHIEEADEW